MKKIILILILVALGWKGYERYGQYTSQLNATPEHALDAQTKRDDSPAIELVSPRRSTFACDGRVYCSQMTSCDEAKYFVEHCPNVKMDGNHDGVPCEKQWCS